VRTMKFCDKCGTFMKLNNSGYSCLKCGIIEQIDQIEIRREGKKEPEMVYVVNARKTDSFKINRKCPRCSNSEAYKVVLSTQGEHAGVKQDRTLIKYTCTKCGRTWTGN